MTRLVMVPLLEFETSLATELRDHLNFKQLENIQNMQLIFQMQHLRVLNPKYDFHGVGLIGVNVIRPEFIIFNL